VQQKQPTDASLSRFFSLFLLPFLSFSPLNPCVVLILAFFLEPFTIRLLSSVVVPYLGNIFFLFRDRSKPAPSYNAFLFSPLSDLSHPSSPFYAQPARSVFWGPPSRLLRCAFPTRLYPLFAGPSLFPRAQIADPATVDFDCSDAVKAEHSCGIAFPFTWLLSFKAGDYSSCSGDLSLFHEISPIYLLNPSLLFFPNVLKSGAQPAYIIARSWFFFFFCSPAWLFSPRVFSLGPIGGFFPPRPSLSLASFSNFPSRRFSRSGRLSPSTPLCPSLSSFRSYRYFFCFFLILFFLLSLYRPLHFC